MEKINKEELMKKLNLTEEELEKVAGGNIESSKCQSCLSACFEGTIRQGECFDLCASDCRYY